MEELDLKELFRIFWNKRLQVILVILIFIVIGVIYTIGFITPMYSASTTLVLATADDTNKNKGTSTEDTTNSITTTDVTLNSKLVSTYSELVKSKNIVRQVISNLNLSIQEEELRDNVTVNSVKDTELIEITVTNENATYSAKMANEIANVFTEKVKEIYNINNVHVVDQAEVPSNPSNINHIKDIVIFIFIGILMAIAYVLISNMLDNTVKTSEDIERGFDLPVLAAIPMNDLELKKVKGGKLA